MSIIHRCRDEVTEQDSSEEIFHLVAVFVKKVPHLRILRNISCLQLIKNSAIAKSCREAFIGWVEMQSGCFISKSSDEYNFSSD